MTMTEPYTRGRAPEVLTEAYRPPTPRGRWDWTDTSRAFVEALQRLGGEAHERNGRATRILKEEANDDAAMSSTAGVLGRMEKAGLIARTMNGKRTYSIRLVGYSAAVATRGASVPALDRQPIGPGEQADALRSWVDGSGPELPDVVTPNPLPVLDYTELAQALLGTVMATIDERDVGTLRLELDAVKARLGQQMDETQRLRRKLDAAEDAHRAVVAERDSVRAQLRSAEDNLRAVLAAGSVSVDEQTRAAIARFMEAPPTPGKG